MDCDYLIVGQGLAGTVLGWQLRARGRHVVFVDRGEPGTASKVAAGLINPITGQRVHLTWRWAEFHDVARRFYSDIEAETGVIFFRKTPLVRILREASDVKRWEETRLHPEVLACLSDPQPVPLTRPGSVNPGLAGFEIASAYMLNVPEFLAASRKVFEVRTEELNVVNQIDAQSDRVVIETRGGAVSAERVVFCQGPDGQRGNPFFDWVPFNCAKGEILTVECEALRDEHRVLNGPGWLAPLPGQPGVFRAGSTYAHSDLSNTPTSEGRGSIEDNLRRLLKAPFETVDHAAAVRPIIRRSRALAGMHPTHTRVGFFNGLGSKGTLNAPAIAEKFVAQLEDGIPMDHELDLLRNL
jgi:glycine oxidase